MLVVGCWLLVVGCWFLVVGCWFLDCYNVLSVICYLQNIKTLLGKKALPLLWMQGLRGDQAKLINPVN
ncbi:hypothetical protein ABWT76_000573 [Planktothricoides raciborskii GIHE-MW2]|uniref:Uncharacterized protein n=1 Tax=Planktothricoides raciborskii GIHE-MW2 TaxID=2792601 RepID=A0AAU8JG95_9CYAN|nr:MULTISPECIES: hypothetical protein [Planktothricoides]